MLRGYASEPESFIGTVAEREPLPLEWWSSRLSDQPTPDAVVFGTFVGDRLGGVAGLRFERRERTKHKAALFGMYVVPEMRGNGYARALVEAVLAESRSTSGIRVVRLTVTSSSAAAKRLYESCGFRSFGTEPLAVKVGERFVDLVHMWCEL